MKWIIAISVVHLLFSLLMLSLLLTAFGAASTPGVLIIGLSFGGGGGLGFSLGMRRVQNKWSASHAEIYGP